MPVRTKVVDRHLASTQLEALVRDIGLEAIKVHFQISLHTLTRWRSNSIPKNQCAAVGALYRQVAEKLAS